jgi:hypothetical protein
MKIPKTTAAPNMTTVPKINGTYGLSCCESGIGLAASFAAEAGFACLGTERL